MALTGDKVWGWGQGLSEITEDPTSFPVEVTSTTVLCETKKTKVKKMASADSFAMFLLENGQNVQNGK